MHLFSYCLIHVKKKLQFSLDSSFHPGCNKIVPINGALRVYEEINSQFWIRPDEAGAFLENTHPKCSPGTRMEP
jgi:hypothetical protein